MATNQVNDGGEKERLKQYKNVAKHEVNVIITSEKPFSQFWHLLTEVVICCIASVIINLGYAT